MDTENIIEGRRGRPATKIHVKTPKIHVKTPKIHIKTPKIKAKSITGCKGKDKYISKLKQQIMTARLQLNDLFSANNRLINKNNSLLDNIQYFRTLILGNKNVKGYNAAIIDEKLKYDNIAQQELNQTVNENFTAADSNYNALKTENDILTNQLNTNANESSLQNQLFINLNNRTSTLAYINSILEWVIFVIICIAAYFIWFGDKSLKDRLVLIKVVWIYLLIVGTLEYVLFYASIYLRALFGGRAYQSHDYWKFPTFTLIDKLIVVLLVLSLFLE